MKKCGPVNFPRYIAALLLATVALTSPIFLPAQGYLKAQLRFTNCDLSSHEADRWYFGQNAGMDFRPQNPVVDGSNWTMNFFNTTAVMADSLGNILFFTNGNEVWSGNHQLMPNGDSLHGYIGNTMPVIIVPKPGSDHIYYIFTTFRPKQYPSDVGAIYGLEYNEVDMSLNGGHGDVTKKNKQLLPPDVSQKITAIRNSNGVDYWVVAHKFNSNEFCTFSVTGNGVDTNSYVSSAIGMVHAGPGSTNNGLGYMKVSPDGKKLAIAVYGSNVFEIFDFNASNGKVTNVITSPATFEYAYGVEFSSDSKYLYGTCTPYIPPQPNFTPPSYLFQFDVNQGGSIFSNFDTLAIDNSGSYFAGIQLGTDGRIYINREPFGSAALSVIENPKRPAPDCNYKSGAFDLQGKLSHLGFPNFIQSYFDLPHFDVENVCFSDTTIFAVQNNSNIDNLTWNFGDPTSGANSATGFQPTHIFSGPGTYTVEVTETYNGNTYGPYPETVVVNELPETSLPDTMYMYPGSPINLDAGSGFTSYEWSTGESKQVITVSQPGTYYVTMQNERCCFNSDSVLVIVFDVIVPNAFRPGGANPLFKAIPTSNEAINNFSLYVYNRWGQELFYTGDIGEGWDGTYKGKEAPGDVYVWLITYDVQREGKNVKIAYKGNVILLR